MLCGQISPPITIFFIFSLPLSQTHFYTLTFITSTKIIIHDGGVKTLEEICGICNKKIFLSEHPSGLVFDDEHFLCEDCSQLSEATLSQWTKKTVMQSPSNGMPIALWLIHEQNKDKPLFSKRK